MQYVSDVITIASSSVSDGSMSIGVNDEARLVNRTNFLTAYGISPERTILVPVQYDGDNYCRFTIVSSAQAGRGIVTPSLDAADALFTTSNNVALLLPVADCVAIVLHDIRRNVLGLLHLGRHGLLQSAGMRAVEYMTQTFGSSAYDLRVYLGPAAGKENYPLYAFGNRSLHEVALRQLETAGVEPANITVDRRDTTVERSLFSHSQYLAGNRSHDGRQAVVAMLKRQ
jgi:copper oxidase (laccase) domain-containing protein